VEWFFSDCGSGGYRFNPGWSPRESGALQRRAPALCCFGANLIVDPKRRALGLGLGATPRVQKSRHGRCHVLLPPAQRVAVRGEENLGGVAQVPGDLVHRLACREHQGGGSVRCRLSWSESFRAVVRLQVGRAGECSGSLLSAGSAPPSDQRRRAADARDQERAAARRSLRHDGRRPPPRQQLDDDGAQNRICVCTRTRCSGYEPDENVSCLT
jgi:hypothetical protein